MKCIISKQNPKNKEKQIILCQVLAHIGKKEAAKKSINSERVREWKTSTSKLFMFSALNKNKFKIFQLVLSQKYWELCILF